MNDIEAAKLVCETVAWKSGNPAELLVKTAAWDAAVQVAKAFLTERGISIPLREDDPEYEAEQNEQMG